MSAWSIYARRGKGPVLRFDGRHFSNTKPGKLFDNPERAKSAGLRLLAQYPILKQYRVWTSPASAARRNVQKRRSNPAVRSAGLRRAAQLLKDFSGHDPEEILSIEQKPITRGLVVGRLAGVLYDTVRDGAYEEYIHQFKIKSRPLLVSSEDGTQLGIVGGRFQFTEAGIEDR